LREALQALEAEAPALGQDDFGIGHIAIACALCYLDFRFDALHWREGNPALTAWHAAAMARPSFVATPVVDD
jgi:glutathione S-transferase